MDSVIGNGYPAGTPEQIKARTVYEAACREGCADIPEAAFHAAAFALAAKWILENAKNLDETTFRLHEIIESGRELAARGRSGLI
jgi:hypothetical protein